MTSFGCGIKNRRRKKVWPSSTKTLIVAFGPYLGNLVVLVNSQLMRKLWNSTICSLNLHKRVIKLICFYFVKLCILRWDSVLKKPIASFCRGKHPIFLRGKISRQEPTKINGVSSMTIFILIELKSFRFKRFVFTEQNGCLINLIEYRLLFWMSWNLISTWFSFSLINISDFWFGKFFEANAYKVLRFVTNKHTHTDFKNFNLYKID